VGQGFGLGVAVTLFMKPFSNDGTLSRARLIGGSLAATAALGFPNIARAQSSTVRIITYPTAVGALPLYAVDKGFFKDAGIAAEFPTMNSGAAILSAVAGGSAEIGNANVGTVATAIGKGLPFSVVADAALYTTKNPVTVLITGQSAPYQKAADLNGKTLGVNGLGGLMHAGLMAWLDKNGGDSKSVKFVELGFSVMGPALEAGRVDATFISEPQLTAAKASKARVLAKAFDAVGSQFSLSAYTASKTWLASNPALAHSFRSVIERTAKWANENGHEAETLLAQYMKIDPSVVYATTQVQYPTTLEASNLQPVVDVLTKYAFLPDHVDARTIMTRV
jgi:NitT/TauT family transport system substrate-binding protein